MAAAGTEGGRRQLCTRTVLAGKQVLIVEDERSVREVCARILARAGATLLTAGDGEAGLEQLRAHAGDIDAVVLDVTMPKLGGLAMLGRLRVQHPHLPVVLTSGYDEGSAADMVERDPATHFLPKPYSPHALVNLLAHVIDAAKSTGV